MSDKVVTDGIQFVFALTDTIEVASRSGVDESHVLRFWQAESSLLEVLVQVWCPDRLSPFTLGSKFAQVKGHDCCHLNSRTRVLAVTQRANVAVWDM